MIEIVYVESGMRSEFEINYWIVDQPEMGHRRRSEIEEERLREAQAEEDKMINFAVFVVVLVVIVRVDILQINLNRLYESVHCQRTHGPFEFNLYSLFL